MNNIYNNSSEIKKDTLYQFDESDVFLFAGLTFILKFVLIVMSICDRDFKTLLYKTKVLKVMVNLVSFECDAYITTFESS